MIKIIKKQGKNLVVTNDDDSSHSVPKDENNRHYIEVLEWVKDGGVIENEFTAEELFTIEIEKQTSSVNNAIQAELDSKAQTLRYDNINAIGKYVGYENDFRAEAEKLGAWASSCWKVAGVIEADVKAGDRDMPTVDKVLAELPVFV
ncbi:hypothetical protein [Sulfurimonas sp.]|uniref:hypothetical protein n=1 Tax=Sulfurimonas sp. TaxID=2022749 RepID=UPI0025E40F51|nr:hypothetical protein [Sulfurimonas sp.]